MKPILEMLNVKMKRGSRGILHIEKLVVDKGELVSLIGPNGSGKSTLLQVINLLLPIESGVIRLYGEETARMEKRELRQRCGLVFQEALLTKDTVFNNVALPLKLRGVPKAEIADRVAKALDQFRCSHLINRLAYQLSGGEMQRVSLARALICEPELLLLDEPFTALDPATRHSMIIDLKRIAQEQNMTVLLVSHALSDVLHFTERAIVLQTGRIVQDDNPETILRRPATAAVATLVGMDNMLPCTLIQNKSGTVVKLSDSIHFDYPESVLPKQEAFCCLPGDIFYFNDNLPHDNTPWVQLDVKVRQVIRGIGVYEAIVEAPGLPLTIKASREQARRYLEPGSQLRLTFDPREAQIV
jgi:tungstate transport system ATP-binding protein